MSDIDVLKDYVSKNGGLVNSLVVEPGFWQPNREFFVGMTLRDYFAGQALTGVLYLCKNDHLRDGESTEDMFASRAYELADAMLSARKETGSE